VGADDVDQTTDTFGADDLLLLARPAFPWAARYDERMRAKTKIKMPIPQPLRLFLRDVHDRIQAGDKASLRESDDLFQANPADGGPCAAYGGLGDAKAGLFGFSYFPDDQENDGDVTWEFRVTREEIQQIATGKKDQLELWKCASADCPLLHATETAYCSFCDR
jgi:hypothetical protein